MIDFSEKYREIEEHWKEIEARIAQPEILADRRLYADLTRKHRELSDVVTVFRERERLAGQLEQARELAGDADPEMAEMAQQEIKEIQEAVKKAETRLQLLLLPSDPRDAKNIIMEIRAGTGGDEAGLFAGDLFRMYNLYAERKGWKVDLIAAHPTDLGGFKEVSFLIAGERVYSRLKYEAGTHRVQRVPTTETQGRIHTSAVTVAVLPEAEEVDLVIKDADIKIEVFRSSGPGGQSVNTTDSAVRITHLASGLVVSQQDEKSQIKNRAKAMKVLRSRLYDLEEEKKHNERSAERKQQVGTGDRSGRIRTYNFPENRVSDHRIDLKLYSLDQILQGGLDPIVEPLITYHQAEALKNL